MTEYEMMLTRRLIELEETHRAQARKWGNILGSYVATLNLADNGSDGAMMRDYLELDSLRTELRTLAHEMNGHCPY